MKILCEYEEVELETDDGRDVEGVMVTCSRCGHATESFGTSSASLKRCCVLLREECPKNESNFYVVEEEDEY